MGPFGHMKPVGLQAASTRPVQAPRLIEHDVQYPIDRPAAVDTPARRLSYVSSLDGLRAVAVIAVVAFHAEPRLVRGGFLGVDVFFVVSGFLITSLLISERAGQGWIDARAFWRRRVRRLGPALLTMLSAVALAGLAWTPSDQLTRLRIDGLATLGYVMNWRLILQGESYFDAYAAPSPLRHMWSLAVEEQFYLVWPVVAAIVLARNRRSLGPVAVGIGAASMVVMAVAGGDLDRIYYGTDTRLHVLMVGCVLAVVAHEKPAWLRWVSRSPTVPLAATAALVIAMMAIGETTPYFYPAGLVVFALVSAVAIAGCVGLGDVPVLSSGVLVEVGKRSYGLYLWHWPVQVFLTDDRLGLGHVGSTVVRFAAMALLTWASYRFIERPVVLQKRMVPRWSLALPVAVAAVLVGTTSGATTSMFEGGDAGQTLSVKAEDVAELPTDASGSEIQSLLITGDSVPWSMAPDLADAFASEGIEVTLHVEPGCGVTEGQAISENGDVDAFVGECAELRSVTDREVARMDPDVVLVFAQADGNPMKYPDGTYGTADKSPAKVQALLEQATDRLGANGATVVYTLPADTTADFSPEGDVNRRLDAYRTVIRRLAFERDDVLAVDLQRLICPREACVENIDGVVLRADGMHFSAESAPLIAPQIRDAVLTLLASG